MDAWRRERRGLLNTLLVAVAALAAMHLPLALARDLGVLVAGFAGIRAAGLLAFRFAVPATGAKWPRIAEDIALIAAYVAWGFVRLRAAGMDLASLVTTSAVITAVIAFAMQDTLGNVLGGLFLEFDRSIAIGDWIKLDDLSGRVVEIRWRHTAIRTRNGERVIVPNSALMKSRFAVIGNPDEEEVRWRRWIWFAIGFDTPPAKALAVARQALAGAEIDGVAREPAPTCVLMEFGPGAHKYALRYWLTDPQADDVVDTQVRLHLVAAFQRAGIALALPESVFHQVKENQARQDSLRARETERRMAALQEVELFAALTREERLHLAEHLVPAPFAAGDVMTRQGAVAHWLYLLVAGEAEVWVDVPGDPRRNVATLGPGTVFGEMGMMTGEPRRATVMAKTDVECYRLDKAGFQEILQARPAIAEQMSQVLAARATGLQHAAEAANTAAAVRPDTVLARIRAFFGLQAAIALPPGSGTTATRLRPDFLAR